MDDGLVLGVRDADVLAVDVSNLILIYSFTRKPRSPLRATKSNKAGGGDKRLITYGHGSYMSLLLLLVVGCVSSPNRAGESRAVAGAQRGEGRGRD